MKALGDSLEEFLQAHEDSRKPLAVVLAGHNGSGKSTMWSERLAPRLEIPLINADRMMMSILPELSPGGSLPAWATTLRDTNANWMAVAQKGVEGFVAQAMARQVPFAIETVFSHLRERQDGTIESKVDQIRQMQAAGYFVVLFFVGLSSPQLSVARVQTRVAKGGHDVPLEKLHERFPRTQQAIQLAIDVADCAILADNSRTPDEAFSVCHIRLAGRAIFDSREGTGSVPSEIAAWLDVVCPDMPRMA